MLTNIAILFAAAFFELLGCWFMIEYKAKMAGGADWHMIGSMVSLAAFALLVSMVDLGLAGRTFAAYGGIYIVGALIWFLVVDKGTLTSYDLIGVLMALCSSAVIAHGGTK